MTHYNIHCTDCPRLAGFLADTKSRYPDYFCKPVPSFGDVGARLLVVGLAPGMHGANRSGRPFTGDHAGLLLYETLHKYGFASKPESVSVDDGLEMPGCRITNAVKCLPPANKPTGAEIRQCNDYLRAEIQGLPPAPVMIALGKIAHDAVLRALRLKLSGFPFAHGAEHRLADDRVLLDSYHCSRYNTQTRRLTAEMFEAVFARAADILAA